MASNYSTWTEEKKERKKQANAKWRERNPQRMLHYQRTYRKRHSHKVAATQRLYRENNPELIYGLKKRWRLENPDKVRVYKKKWYRKYKDAIWLANIFSRYGVTEQKFEEMWAAQNGLCAICATDLSQLNRKADIDHCHSTGRVRGLLCPPCNRVLGFYEKHAEKLDKYLERQNI